MAGERAGHSLQATVLVNEAYLRLVSTKDVAWQDRAHFLAVAARVMRRILVDHARARRARKRGGSDTRVTFDEALVVTNEPRQDFVALDDALEMLATFDPRKSRVIELRFFGGLSVNLYSGASFSAPRLRSLKRPHGAENDWGSGLESSSQRVTTP